ncbi:hypothetical protein WMY93_024934 [Mugilogobius chulae]|uniref:HAT C-terminal dimerisation domain-containing protein n=1 Tax=Mugilogobius chulae TaxID=88201 RepID=A0AAW0N5E2_9GOBI
MAASAQRASLNEVDDLLKSPFSAMALEEKLQIYHKRGRVVERFLSFSPLTDRTAEGLEKLLKDKLEPYKLENKLIAQTYDGAAVMSGASSGLQSPKRTAVLDEVCGRRIPASGQTRWNFKSRTKRTTDALITRQAREKFCSSMTEIKDKLATDDVEPNPDTRTRRPQRTNNIQIATQCCDIMMEQLKVRFEKARHLAAFELIDPEFFPHFKDEFPQNQLLIASEFYPMICKEKLKSELTVIYNGAEFAGLKSASSLLEMLTKNNLQTTFSETLKLTQIAITTPVTSAEAERCFSTLKRIKSFLRSSMGQARLNALAVLSVERELVQNTPDFNERVIDLFASQKGRRCELHFK